MGYMYLCYLFWGPFCKPRPYPYAVFHFLRGYGLGYGLLSY